MEAKVSIHAPARGATHPEALIPLKNKFQSTHPHGVRRHGSLKSGFPKRFQSTHPHGVRRNSVAEIPLSYRFQSTHPHGVRQSPSVPSTRIRSFNPRTRTGCDRLSAKPSSGTSISFNPRTRTGCDGRISGVLGRDGCFNPRTRTGCDRTTNVGNRWHGSFNPRTRTGCDFNLLSILRA